MSVKTTTPFFILLFTLILTSSCSGPAVDTSAKAVTSSDTSFDIAAVRKIIDEKNAAFGKAFGNGDSATMVNNYTKDAKIFAPNSPVVAGKDSMAVLISEYLKYGIKEFKDEATTLYGNENNVIEEGKYFMGDGKGNTIDKGKYICVWRKEDGVWKLYADIFNTSIPPAPAKK
jgi:ketosteroid isomerase-like protein